MSDAVGKSCAWTSTRLHKPVDCRSRELVLDKATGVQSLQSLWLVIRGRRHDKKKSSECDEVHACYEAEESFFVLKQGRGCVESVSEWDSSWRLLC